MKKAETKEILAMFRIDGELILAQSIPAKGEQQPEVADHALWRSFKLTGALPFEPCGYGKTVSFNAAGIYEDMFLVSELTSYDATDATFHATFYIAHAYKPGEEAAFMEWIKMVLEGLSEIGFAAISTT